MWVWKLTPKRHVFQRDETTCTNIFNHYRFNDQDKWGLIWSLKLETQSSLSDNERDSHTTSEKSDENGYSHDTNEFANHLILIICLIA